jgi:hypothetical protein
MYLDKLPDKSIKEAFNIEGKLKLVLGMSWKLIWLI